MAAVVFLLKGDDDLRKNVDIRPISLSGDIDSIKKGKGRSMSPARTTVLWNMLVSHVGQVVNAVNVIPEPVRWEVLDMLEFLSDHILSISQWIPLLLVRSRGINVSSLKRFFSGKNLWRTQANPSEVSELSAKSIAAFIFLYLIVVNIKNIQNKAILLLNR